MSMRRPPLAQLSMSKPGHRGQQVVPHLVEPRDVPDLGHADAVGRVGLVPVGPRIKVEVLAVTGDVALVEHFHQLVRQCLPSRRIAEIVKVIGPDGAKQILRMLAAPRGSLEHALGFEPEQEADVHLLQRLAHGTEPLGKVSRDWGTSRPPGRPSCC